MHRLETNFDSYEILETIGEGTLGTVYRSRQIRLNREVAVKFIGGDFAGNFTAEEFSKEAQGHAALCHPNIAMVLDAGATRGQPFIVTELVSGVDLGEYVDAGAPEDGEIIGIMCQICDAMVFAHEHDMLHLDLIPQHVLLSDSGWIKLVDFRLSRPFRAGGVGSRRAAPFLPPELVQGQAVDERSDVYSIGKLLWFLASGEIPPVHPEKAELDDGCLREPWRETIGKAVRADPDDRFQSVAEMKEFGCRAISEWE